MKIAVIGAGAIGGLVAGYLKLKGLDVSLAGHPDSVMAIKKDGLNIQGVRGEFKIDIDASEKLNSKSELVILATKTQDIPQALEENLNFIKDTILLTTQNGIRAEEIVARYLASENIISSIVMFGATLLKPAVILHNFEGNWILGGVSGRNAIKLNQVSQLLNQIFPVVISQDIKGMKHLKIFVNANNCIPAILGITMQEAFSDLDISCISIAIWKEGIDIINKLGIKLISLPDFPVERITKLTSLPISEAARIFSGIMVTLSKEPLYGSILQSIKRGRPSEIDYINGEFVNLAKTKNLKAPLNERLTEMVHQVEQTHKFFSKEELINNTQGLLLRCIK